MFLISIKPGDSPLRFIKKKLSFSPNCNPEFSRVKHSISDLEGAETELSGEKRDFGTINFNVAFGTG